MTKRLTFNKINRWIIFILALLPFICLLWCFLKVQFIETEEVTPNTAFQAFNISLSLTNNALSDCVGKLPWLRSLLDILLRYGFLGNHTNQPDFILFAYLYFNYLFEIMFLDLVFQCFTFFISLIRNAVEKLGGDF